MPAMRPREAADIAASEFDIPFLAELPSRGPGADMLGRGLSLLTDVAAEFAGETTPTGWRLSGSGTERTRAMRVARAYLDEDLDALEERLQDHSGPVKFAVVGPWTLAANVETASGEKVLRDHGARRDLAEGLAEAVARHARAIERRLPNATLVLQVDEPSLPAVLRGEVRTASGLHTYRTIHVPEAASALTRIHEHAGLPAVAHCCAHGSAEAIDVFIRAGFAGISIDATLWDRRNDEQVAEFIDGGRTLFAGIVPSSDSGHVSTGSILRPLTDFGSRLGFDMPTLAAASVLTPACGMAGASPQWARHAATLLRRAGRALRDDSPDGAAAR